jgi:hypothetical protein
MTQGLTYGSFQNHIAEYEKTNIIDWFGEVLIRTATDDYVVAAVHCDKGVVIIDMGQRKE